MKNRLKSMSAMSATLVTVLLISVTTLTHAIGDRFTTLDFPSPGVTDTEATALTPSGVIVGRYFTPDGVQHGFVLNEGRFSSLDVPGAHDTDAAWINAHSDIVGTGKMGLTEVGAKLAGLHLGCVEVEKLVASGLAPPR
jgi:hypothetical protein